MYSAFSRPKLRMPRAFIFNGSEVCAGSRLYISCTDMYTLCMGVFSKQEQHFLSSVANLGYGNPFLPERMAFEKAVLGREFVPGGDVWSASVSDPDAAAPNEGAIYKK